jgi:Lon protease-like protein
MLQRIPLFPLGLVLLPGMPVPLHIFEERYKRMIADCMDSGGVFGIVWFDGSRVRPVGCTARIERVLERYPDGRLDILVVGERRFATVRTIEEKPYLEAEVTAVEDDDPRSPEAEILARARALLRGLSFAIPALEGFAPAERQRLLEMTSTAERLRACAAALEPILERARLTQELRKIIGGNGRPIKASIRALFPEPTSE